MLITKLALLLIYWISNWRSDLSFWGTVEL